jgi:hypothetical protein
VPSARSTAPSGAEGTTESCFCLTGASRQPFVRSLALRSADPSEQRSGSSHEPLSCSIVCLKFDSSLTRAKSIPAGSLDLSLDLPALHWFFGAVGGLEVSG